MYRSYRSLFLGGREAYFKNRNALFFSTQLLADQNLKSDYGRRKGRSFMIVGCIASTLAFLYKNRRKVFDENLDVFLVRQLNALSSDTRVRDLFESIRYGQHDSLRSLLNNPSQNQTLKEAVDERHPYGWTLLQTAVINRDKNAVRMLLNAGADVNAGDAFTNVATVAQKMNVHPISVYRLRQDEFHESLSVTHSFFGFTALHYAVLADDEEIVKMLIDAGADPTKVNDAGHKPSEYALPQMKKQLINFENKFMEKMRERMKQIRKLKPLENVLSENIVGQKEAVASVAASIRRKESGWFSEDKPLVFLFLGSSGVGKTELAKQIAKYISAEQSINTTSSSSKLDENIAATCVEHGSFVRIDMSEYQQSHEVSKFIGAPPGYVGYQEGGQLTEALLKNPNAIVLLDEIDKANVDVLTILLQLFDEGRLTDGKGKTVDGRKAIFVMTSNLANSEIGEFVTKTRTSEDFRLPDLFKEKVVKPILKRHFRRDEFLGRINEIVYFLPFTRAETMSLVERELSFWAKVASEKHNIHVEWDESVVYTIADRFDPTYGARSLKHEVDRSVIGLIAKAHELDLIGKGNRIKIVTEKDDAERVHFRLQKLKNGLLSAGSYENVRFKEEEK